MIHAKSSFATLSTVSAMLAFVIGCSDSEGRASSQASQSLTVPLPTINQYVIMASRTGSVGDRNNVSGGDIGIAPSGTATPNSFTAGIDTRVGVGEVLLAQRMVLRERVVAGELGANVFEVAPSATTGPRSPFIAPPAQPVPTGTFTSNATNVTVGTGATQTLAGGTFGAVTVSGTLNLSGGTYNVLNLRLNPDARLVAQASSTVRVVQGIAVSDRGFLQAPTPQPAGNLRFIVNGVIQAPSTSVQLGTNVQMRALVIARNVFQSADRLTASGAIAAQDVILGNDSTLAFNTGFGCTTNAQCNDNNPCTADSCVNTACVNSAAPNGTACSDGNACTQTDTCQAGTCTGANPVVCTASDQCHDPGVCNPANGTCSNPNRPNGTVCSDANACTQTDTCQAGTCTGANPVVCTASDQCHDPGVCNPANGMCSNPARPNGTACSDMNACTMTDTCQAGTCTGANPVVCMASDQCHDPGICNPMTGMCSNPNRPDGTACTDGSACTTADTCQMGACVSGPGVVCTAQDECHDVGVCDPASGTCSNPARPDGTACSDENGCTEADTCQMGACVSGTPVVCTASNDCHDPGVCDPATGTCSDPVRPDGTVCNDGSACTQTDACQMGECVGSGDVICTASDECHDVGVCDPETGTCSDPASPDGTPCDDENECSVGDACQGGVCTAGGDFTVTEFATTLTRPYSIISGPLGRLWFVSRETAPGSSNGTVSSITTAGAVSSVSAFPRDPYAMIQGPDGLLWLAERFLGGLPAIGRFDTATGTFASDYFLGILTNDMAATNDSAGPVVWLTAGSSVVRVNPAGMVLSTTPTMNVARAITTAAPAANTTVWFTQAPSGGVGRIGRIQFPTVAQFTVPATGELMDIVEGPDGGIWFTDTGGNRVARLSPDGATLAGFPVPSAAAFPHGITAGPDGNLWFTERDANKIGLITTAGDISEICIPTAASEPTTIAAGSDGNIWFTETASGKIGRVTLPVMASAEEPAEVASEAPEASDSGCSVASRRTSSGAAFGWLLALGLLAGARRRVASGRRVN
jgi:streptogramin lyase